MVQAGQLKKKSSLQTTTPKYNIQPVGRLDRKGRAEGKAPTAETS